MNSFSLLAAILAFLSGLGSFSFAEGTPTRIPGVPSPSLNPSTDWPWWRGMHRDGRAEGSSGLPIHLDVATNADWKVRVPGIGHASPIVVGNRVYLLSTDPKEQTQFVVAYDRDTGKQRWQTELNRGGFAKKNHPKNSEGNSTLASDGERLFAAVWHDATVWGASLSLEGELLWKKEVGRYDPQLHPYGYAPSPVLYNDSVIYSYEYEGPSALVALHRQSGEEKWRINRPQSTSYSTPMIVSWKGRDYLVHSGAEKVCAYRPENGTLIWETPGVTQATSGTIVAHDGMIFASGGYPGSETIGIDLETGKVVWKNRQRSYEQSMIVAKGALYNFTDSGVLYCWDCKTGKENWKQRMSAPISASAVLVGDRIYWSNETGKLWVIEANSERYVELAENQVGDEALASPAVAGGQIFLRVAFRNGNDREEVLIRFSGDEAQAPR